MLWCLLYVFTLTKFSKLAALEVVKLTTSSAASDKKFVNMMTFSFQWVTRIKVINHSISHYLDQWHTRHHRVSITWWRHQMKTFSALLTLCAGNSPVTGEFPAQRSVTRNSDVFFDLLLNKRLSKQLWRWWFETPSQSLWRQYNEST